MALKSLIQFPILAPPNPTHQRPATEVRFSRWNSSTNAENFIRQERTQNPNEDELRHLKRFNSAENATSTTANETFKSTGVPSSPSRPSNTSNKSYSKTPGKTHPAFRRISKAIRVPTDAAKAETAVRVSEDGVSYVLPNAPFAFQHSYTETPKVKPLHLREPPVAPFGPSTMPRPWTGRKPLPPGKKKLEFDSFRLPPAGKKGVKPVQAPGPFLPGSGPKYVRSREEVLGEPLTKEEVDELVTACKKTRRQLNMGRDGLTHNMLDNIHALWKRKRVCKIKCLGVCTVDMDNVRQQLEEKTGGKIIYSRGGIIYLFRGRNYNYKTRPQFPLMLWKPITPVYPKLIERAPGGLTVEEAREMRDKGRKLTPICKLGKNGVYCDLVKNVKEAFEACELVRINCEGMNANDYRKIGAKLKDLVPCVLISFEREHILMWRGRDWQSSLPQLVDVSDAKNSEADGVISDAQHLEGQVVNTLSIPKPDTNVVGGEGTSTKAEYHFPLSNDALSLVSGSVSNAIDVCSNSETDGAISISPHLEGEVVTASPILSEGLTCLETLSSSTSPICNGDVQILGANSTSMEAENHLPDTSSLVSPSLLNETDVSGSKTPSTPDGRGYDAPDGLTESHGGKIVLRTAGSDNDEATITSVSDSIDLEKPLSSVPPTWNELQDSPETLRNLDEPTSMSSPWTEEVLVLWKEAIECGRATVLDDSSLDADVVYRRAVALSQSAPPGPVFRHRRKKVAVRKLEEPKTEDLAVKEEVLVSEKEGSEKKRSSINRRMKGIKREYLNEVPQGSLGVDELAKLLA